MESTVCAARRLGQRNWFDVTVGHSGPRGKARTMQQLPRLGRLHWHQRTVRQMLETVPTAAHSLGGQSPLSVRYLEALLKRYVEGPPRPGSSLN